MLTPLTDGDSLHIGPYRVTNRIGTGGMGAVYLGFDDEGKPAAVKVPFVDRAEDPQFRARFRREVEAARKVRGRCVAELLDADADAERPWMAAEYVEGASLADAVRARGAVEPRILNGLAVGLADALVAIHSAGVVHRDLKPSNVLLAWDGPKVIDFGIAKSEDSVNYTKTGMLVGTLVWMAPEQLRGNRASPATDVFAWGACIAFAATGRPPFHAEGMHAVALQIINAEPDLDGVPEHLLPHVRATLAKDPAERPTATELLTALVGRDVADPGDADSAARTALGAWVAAPPTAAQTAMLGDGGGSRPDRRSDGRDRAATVSAPGGYGGSGYGGGGYGGPPQYPPTAGGPAGAAGRRGMPSTAAMAAVVAILVVAAGIALVVALSGGNDGGGRDQGIVPTSTLSPNESTTPGSTPGEQASGGPSTQPGETRTQTQDSSPSATLSPSASVTPSRSPTSSPTSSPTPPPTEVSSTPSPNPSTSAAGATGRPTPSP